MPALARCLGYGKQRSICAEPDTSTSDLSGQCEVSPDYAQAELLSLDPISRASAMELDPDSQRSYFSTSPVAGHGRVRKYIETEQVTAIAA